MNDFIKVTPETLAAQLNIDPKKLQIILIAVGFAELGNEAYRKAILDGFRVPTQSHYMETIKSLSEEAKLHGVDVNI